MIVGKETIMTGGKTRKSCLVDLVVEVRTVRRRTMKAFNHFYNTEDFRFGGTEKDGFLEWSMLLNLKKIASKVDGDHVLKAFHLTLKGMDMSFYLGLIRPKIEKGTIQSWNGVLSELSSRYITKTSRDRAYSIFDNVSFMEYRKSKDVASLSEIDAKSTFIAIFMLNDLCCPNLTGTMGISEIEVYPFSVIMTQF